MIEARFEGIFQIAVELLFDGEVIGKLFGWVGAGLAWALTLGRSNWEADDWQAMATGGVVVLVVVGVGTAAWLHSSTGV